MLTKLGERTLRRNAALDFDDLLLRAVEVLGRFEEAWQAWRQRFQYLHVDEYQDTNRVQYDLLHLLAGPRPNLCVVGDEDQSICCWRGADVGSNILSFSKDFPEARVFRIEQNYRSCQKILDAASVVSKNVKRIGERTYRHAGRGIQSPFLRST